MKTQVPSLKLISQFKKIGQEESHVDVVLKISVPEKAKSIATERKPIAISLVIDRSGSMSGTPIEQAKLAAISLVERLQKGDAVSLVSYENTPTLLAPLQEVTSNREELKRLIKGIFASGGTGLRSGFLTGAQSLAPSVNEYGLSRVLLISDGQATDGSTPEVLQEEAQSLANVGITTSTYGLGMHFNESLMSAIATGGSGLAFYAETAAELVPYFESEFTVLSSTVGQKAIVSFEGTLDGQAVEFNSLMDLSKSGESNSIGALLESSERFVAVRVSLSSPMKVGAKLEVKTTLNWADTDKQETMSLTDSVTIPVAKKSTLNDDSWAIERLKELEAVRLQKQALEEARKGNWEKSDSLIRGMMANAGDNAYIQSVGASLLSMSGNLNGMSKEAVYSSTAMASRSLSVGEDVTKMEDDRFGLRKASQSRSGK